MQTMTGTIHGTTIELDGTPEMADGAVVEVLIRPAQPQRQRGEGLLRTEGALADDADWDAIMEEIQQRRRLERQPQGEPA